MRTRPTLGTLAWAEITQGNLSRSDRRRQILTVLGIRLHRMARQIVRSKPKPVRLDLESIVVPDSRASLAALELCQAASTPSLANHCLRTYFWAAIFAQADGLSPDAELLFVASLLHDLGLTERFSFKQPACHCFAIEGALAAESFAGQQGWTGERRRLLGDAIAQHLNVSVPPERGVEAHLLQAGAGADVIGTRMETIPNEARNEVLRRHPRLHFKREIIGTLKPQAERRPQSRMGFLFSVGFPKLIQAAPFKE